MIQWFQCLTENNFTQLFREKKEIHVPVNFKVTNCDRDENSRSVRF